MRRWQQRLFALTTTHLIYYKHDLNNPPKKKISRLTIISVLCTENAKNIYEFEIIFENRSMRLRALNIDSRNSWVYYLKPKQRYSESHIPILRTSSLSLKDYVRTVPSPLPIIKLFLKKRWTELHRAMSKFKEGVSFRRSVTILKEYNKKMAKIMRIELAARILNKLRYEIGTYICWMELKSCFIRNNSFTQDQSMKLMSLFETANIRVEAGLYVKVLNRFKRYTKQYAI